MAEFRIKRIYEPPARGDGARILIDRIWPRGVRKEDARLTDWNKEIAPSPALRKWFGHDSARFAEFRRRYRKELEGNSAAVARLQQLARRKRVTLLFAAHDPVHNHARVLLDYLRNQDGEE